MRTRSRTRRGVAWLCVALACLVAYVALSLRLYGAVGWNPLDYRYHRLMLPLAVLFVLVARGTGRKAKKAGGKGRRPAGGRGVPVAPRSPEPGAESVDAIVPIASEREGEKTSDAFETNASTVQGGARPCPPSPRSSVSAAGEELYVRARSLPHRPVPDPVLDEEYLELLGDSAAKGYAPALAKFGEYAMRRGAWVEAYYWMKRAERGGLRGLSPVLLEIRKSWARDDFPDQSDNVSGVFTREAGSIGRALLRVDSGRGAARAREFLKTHHPEF